MNFANLMKQAQTMQKRVNKAKREFNEKEFDIVSNGNLITGKMTGDLKIKELHVDSSLLTNKEELEDLLLITMNNIIEQVSKEREDTLNKITDGVDVSAFL